jgi:GNAT superfamily N-acetyltransferase
MADNKSIDLLREVYEKALAIREQREAKAKEQQAIQDQHAQQQQAEQKPEMLIGCWDADNAGNKISQAERTNDLDKVRAVSGKIQAGQDAIKNWLVGHGCQIIQSGGDEGAFQFSSDLLEQLEAMRAEYRKASGFTCTVGVGRKVSEAVDSRALGKLTGKNRIVVYSDEVGRELKLRMKQQTEQEKVVKQFGKSEGLEKSKIDKDGQPKYNEMGYKLVETTKNDMRPGHYVLGIPEGSHHNVFHKGPLTHNVYYYDHEIHGKSYSINLQDATVFPTAREAHAAIAGVHAEHGVPHEAHKIWRLASREDERGGLKIAKSEPIAAERLDEAFEKGEDVSEYFDFEKADQPPKKRVGGNLPADGQYQFHSHHHVDDLALLGNGKRESCDHCGKTIANVVRIHDSGGNEFSVGEDCADALCSGEAKTRLHDAMSSEKRKQRFINDIVNGMEKTRQTRPGGMAEMHRHQAAEFRKQGTPARLADAERNERSAAYHEKLDAFEQKLQQHFGQGPDVDQHAKRVLKQAVRMKVNQGVADHDPGDKYSSYEQKIKHGAFDHVDAAIQHVTAKLKKSEPLTKAFDPNRHAFKARTSKYRDYTIRSNRPDQNGLFEVTCHHKGREIGNALFLHRGDHVSALTEEETNRHGLDRGTWVDEDHRRKRIATAMYDHAERAANLLTEPAAGDLTEDAKAFWSNRMKVRESKRERLKKHLLQLRDRLKRK